MKKDVIVLMMFNIMAKLETPRLSWWWTLGGILYVLYIILLKISKDGKRKQKKKEKEDDEVDS